MNITYIKLWEILIDRNIKRTDLLNLKNIITVTLAKFSNDKSVSVHTLNRICNALKYEINDIVESELNINEDN